MPVIEQTDSQRMLIPVLIGGASMALISYIPFVNFINCACCAGIMGGAVLGVWFYKKTTPSDQAFGPKQGAKIGALSGVVGAVIYTLLVAALSGAFTGGPSAELNQSLQEMVTQMESSGQDPQAVEEVGRIMTDLVNSPWTLAAAMLGFSLIGFTAFGAIGGAIGGKMFKSAGAPPPHEEFQDFGQLK